MIAPLAYLTEHTERRPDAPAVIGIASIWTFRELHEAVGRAAVQLVALGVRAGQTVGLDLPTGDEWVVDLALLHLGVIGVSLRGIDDRRGVRVDHVIDESSGMPRLRDGGRTVGDSAEAVAWPPASGFGGPDSVFRLLLTSGTTGVPRAAAYSLGAYDYRMADGTAHWTDQRPELTLIGLSTTGGFHAASACLALGIPYLAVDRIDGDSLRLAARHDIEVLCGSPVQIARALHVARAEGISFPSLAEIRLAGALPSAQLLDFIAATTGAPVRNVYGSTEGGGVSQIWFGPGVDRADVGAPLPGVELQVVDPAGREVAVGEEGAIRYRTPGQVSGYLVDGALEPFDDGWFVPGDRGNLTAEGHLVLTGRDSELLNLGGVKIDPQRIDDLAAGFPGLVDAAAFGIERRAGLPEAALAVVCAPHCDLRELDRRLRNALPTGHPTAYWRIDAIPRSRLGKPLRARLTSDYERIALRRA